MALIYKNNNQYRKFQAGGKDPFAASTYGTQIDPGQLARSRDPKLFNSEAINKNVAFGNSSGFAGARKSGGYNPANPAFSPSPTYKPQYNFGVKKRGDSNRQSMGTQIDASYMGPNYAVEGNNTLNNKAGVNTGTGELTQHMETKQMNVDYQKSQQTANTTNQVAGGVGQVANVAVGVGVEAGKEALSDDDATTYTAKEAVGDVAGEVVKSAAGSAAATIGAAVVAGTAIGSAGVGVGAIVGAAVGLIVGGIKYFGGKKKAKEAGKKNEKILKKRNEVKRKNDRDQMDATIMGTLQPTTAQTPVEGPASYQQRGYGSGGSFRFTIPTGAGELKKIEVVDMFNKQSFKRGGKIKATENIIPNGVLHEESNKLGDKGMPVVACNTEGKSCEKKYEIEKKELILTLDTTKEVESMAKKNNTTKLGSYVKEQILNNTHSFTDEFKELNSYADKNESIFVKD